MLPGWRASRPSSLIRILADIHISPKTVAFLNSIGFDAEHSTDHLPAPAPDEDIISKASELGRAIITRDLGFPKLLVTAGMTRPSSVLLRLSFETLEHTHWALTKARAEIEEYLPQGYVVVVEDDRVRFRSLTA